MKKHSINLHPYILLLGLLAFTQCNNTSTSNEQTSIQDISDTSEISNMENINNQIEQSDGVNFLNTYLNKLYARQKLRGTRLNYQVFNNANYKHNFEYLDNWYSIDVNEEGVTYTGVYEIKGKDTLMHFVSIIPEIEMEGGNFINYESDPSFKYYYINNKLSHIKYENPKNKNAKNPLENLNEEKLKTIGDSIKNVIDKYFYLDSLSTNFNGNWEYFENNVDYSFKAKIRQIGSFVSGSYCAYTPIQFDCENTEQGGEPCYLNGYIYSDTLYLDFHSCYAGSSGNAKLYFSHDTLKWNTVYQVEGSLVPERINLKRK